MIKILFLGVGRGTFKYCWIQWGGQKGWEPRRKMHFECTFYQMCVLAPCLTGWTMGTRILSNQPLKPSSCIHSTVYYQYRREFHFPSVWWYLSVLCICLQSSVRPELLKMRGAVLLPLWIQVWTEKRGPYKWSFIIFLSFAQCVLYNNVKSNNPALGSDHEEERPVCDPCSTADEKDDDNEGKSWMNLTSQMQIPSRPGCQTIIMSPM